MYSYLYLSMPVVYGQSTVYAVPICHPGLVINRHTNSYHPLGHGSSTHPHLIKALQLIYAACTRLYLWISTEKGDRGGCRSQRKMEKEAEEGDREGDRR